MASKGQKFNKYLDDLKEEILNKYNSGVPGPHLAKEYSISRFTIASWVRKQNHPELITGNNGGYDYELYNRLCPGMGEPDSNIVEYAEDVLYLVNLLIDNKLRQALFE